MEKSLSAITGDINIEARNGKTDALISGLSYDSRTTCRGDLYFALPGLHADGHAFVEQAIAAGARAVIHQVPLSLYHPEIAYLQVTNSRISMSPVAAAFYDHPSRVLKVIGVTGTDGKSSTVSFLHQLLTGMGLKCGFLSTVQFNTGGESVKNHFRQSTPEATEIHKTLRAMVEAGCSHAVIESTSHGLSPKNNRLGDICYDAAVITNISHEHLEFHGTMEQYMDDKANLFRMTGQNRGIAVINIDDKNHNLFAGTASGCRSISFYSATGAQKADYRARGIEETPASIAFTLDSPKGEARVDLNVAGRFNVDNILAASAAVCELEGVEPKTLEPLFPGLKAVKGRMVPVDEGQAFQVIVDYAHTPGAFRRLFPAIRPLVRGRLFALFSSAGERDLEKRPVLGSIADEYCDVIVLADEDPRGENPMALLEEVASGCRNKTKGKSLFLIENRKEAMRHAFSMMKKDDCILLLGKGHEGSIIYANGPVPWDEEEMARILLRELTGKRE
ncbi:UDP-N-acetylmuramoyl-L-alanyl-D-glutamate--2,6-diaminopimelate ligase [Sediminispirochaeta smaragdinae]|uniref:UDP-N-acetylmuramyl-tripeptide synthetase n=1 Tax=Sediminispirochaeta smaragdinae (strain DSM 11293 / JCM 15392 / SEBR 4228) TaxID=573413 RepID=E1R3M5_SEDSS|nr:UDP-N-acetylmuramoyl-L-alanyl-D-glutamate--2,6-diaminopimelate ligase [Sediminispirochaeta smaragdinae]ADK81996.1 UDP-N-acetylmuramyl-tripeptide synthetase [Sediminispirochaeta smaragdinae DSM 11293]